MRIKKGNTRDILKEGLGEGSEIDFQTELMEWNDTYAENTLLVSIHDINKMATYKGEMSQCWDETSNFKIRGDLLAMAYVYKFRSRYPNGRVTGIRMSEFRSALGLTTSSSSGGKIIEQFVKSGWLKIEPHKKKYCYNFTFIKSFHATGKYGVKFRFKIPPNIPAKQIMYYFRYLLFLNEMHKQSKAIDNKYKAFARDLNNINRALKPDEILDNLTLEDKQKFQEKYKNFVPCPRLSVESLGKLLKIDKEWARILRLHWVKCGWLKKGTFDQFRRFATTEKELGATEFIRDGMVFKPVQVFDWRQNTDDTDNFITNERIFEHDFTEYGKEQKKERKRLKARDLNQDLAQKVTKPTLLDYGNKLFICDPMYNRVNKNSLMAEANYFINPRFYGRIIYEKLTEWEQQFYDKIKGNIYNLFDSGSKFLLST